MINTESSLFLNCFLNASHAGTLTGETVFYARHHSVQAFSSFEIYIQCVNQVVIAARFHASSTPVLIAVLEYLCRWIEGKSMSDFNHLKQESILLDLDLPATLSHVVNLVCQVVDTL